jgi:hypothetical protein
MSEGQRYEIRLVSTLASDDEEFNRRSGGLIAAGWEPLWKSLRAVAGVPGSPPVPARVVMLFRRYPEN